jgi:hypothetical protein
MHVNGETKYSKYHAPDPSDLSISEYICATLSLGRGKGKTTKIPYQEFISGGVEREYMEVEKGLETEHRGEAVVYASRCQRKNYLLRMIKKQT